MVVAGRTQQLIKSSKNLTLSKKFSTYNASVEFKNYLKDAKNVPRNSNTLVRLCCDCRRFHSTDYFQSPREPRSSYTKLTPQEVLLGDSTASPVSEPLGHFQRALSSENPAVELGVLINETLSREKVQAILNDVLPSLVQLRQKLNNEDILENLLRSYVENPNSRLSRIQKRSVEDIESIVFLLNTEIGGSVLVISNDSIVLDVDVLAQVVINVATDYIKLKYPDLLTQIVLVETVKIQVALTTLQLRPILSQVSIPVEVLDELLSYLSGENRSKRDLSDIVVELVRSQLSVILTPIQVQINTVLDSIITVVLSLYSAQEPTDIITSLVTSLTNTVVLRVAEVVVTVQYSVNLVFSNLINGTTVVSARRRRDVDLEFENFYDFSRVDLEVSHKRVARDTGSIFDVIGGVVGNVVAVLANPLNTLVKNIFVAILSSQYEAIGKLVTTPLRLLVDYIVNTILPCVTCVSIV